MFFMYTVNSKCTEEVVTIGVSTFGIINMSRSILVVKFLMAFLYYFLFCMAL